MRHAAVFWLILPEPQHSAHDDVLYLHDSAGSKEEFEGLRTAALRWSQRIETVADSLDELIVKRIQVNSMPSQRNAQSDKAPPVLCARNRPMVRPPPRTTMRFIVRRSVN